MKSRKRNIDLNASLSMSVGGNHLGGAHRMALLAKIAECGSITQAAKAIDMSYKAAWDAIDAMNNLAGEALVVRAVGGKGGGGTRLTARGEQLLANFRTIDSEHQRFVAQLSQQTAGLTDDYVLIRRMAMKTSARNQYIGKVSKLKRGAVNDEVELEISGGQKITAIITHESCEQLALRQGSEAFALIKSSSIILVNGESDARFSARNQLSGVITRVQAGAINTEVVIDLPGGASLAAVVTNGSVEQMSLQPGKTILAIFKASSVIIGVSI